MEVKDTVREKALQDYRKKLLEHKEYESKLKESKFTPINCFIGDTVTVLPRNCDAAFAMKMLHHAPQNWSGKPQRKFVNN